MNLTNSLRYQNKEIVPMKHDSITNNIYLEDYGTTPPSAIDTVVSNLTPANIGAQSIIVTTSQTPCVEGTCTVNVIVTWINNGGSSGIFVPNIIIDDIPVTPAPYPSEPLGAGSMVTKPFTVTGLTVAIHTICPSPNAPVYQAQTVDIIVTE